MDLARRRLLAATALAGAWIPASFAQGWPTRPIRLVVNVPPGAATDVLARAMAPSLGAALGQQVIVENRAGANGNLGVEAVVRSAPDGHTLLHTSGSTTAINPHLYKSSFDVAKDLEPVAPTMRNSILLVVRADSPFRSVADLIAHARAHPGKLNYGSSGIGSGMHIAAEMMLRSAKAQATHVPFKGSPATHTALLGGTVDFAFDPGSSIPHIKAGKMRLLGVARATRTPFFPDSPTMAEAGAEADVDTVFGIYAPAGTPRDIVMRLNREVARSMQSAEVVAALKTMAAEGVVASPEEFAARQRRDRDRFGEFVREAQIQVD